MSIHEVKCINITGHNNPHERIQAIGGNYANGATWKLDQAEAIQEIEEGSNAFMYRSRAGR